METILEGVNYNIYYTRLKARSSLLNSKVVTKNGSCRFKHAWDMQNDFQRLNIYIYTIVIIKVNIDGSLTTTKIC